MSERTGVRRVLVGAGLTGAGIAAALAAAYGVERLVVRRLRRGTGDAGTEGRREQLVPPVDRTHGLETTDGGRLHVIERGSGRPVVLVHGYTLALAVWTLQLERWPELDALRLLAYDQRGHGASSIGSDGLTIDALVDDLVAVLEQLDLHDVVLVGHSLGGMVVQALAARRPDIVAHRVAGAVLLSSAPKGLSITGSPLGAIVERLGAAFGRVAPSVMGHDDIGFLMAAMGVGERPPAWVIERSQELIGATSPETVLAGARVLLRFDVVDELGAIDLPVLVVCGTHDRLTPIRQSKLMAQRIPGARLARIEQAGHVLMLERPDELEALVVEFVRSLPAPAASASPPASASAGPAGAAPRRGRTSGGRTATSRASGGRA